MRSYDHQPSGAIAELRRLRRGAPQPERRLLRALREGFPELKWRHQSPIGPYKPDILCFSERLIIEVDGDTHATSEKNDAARTSFLEREGYRVIRFTNADVMQNVEGVIASVSLSLREREGAAKRRKGEDDQRPSPSPARGYAAPPLSRGERGSEEGHTGSPDSSSSNVTATSALALKRTVSPSTSATRPPEI